MKHQRAAALLAATSMLALAACSSGSKSTTATGNTSAPATSGGAASSSSSTPATSAAASSTGSSSASAPAAGSASAPAPTGGASAAPSSLEGPAPSGKVTISVDCEPPKTQPIPRKNWEQDVAAFEKLYPNITIKSIDTAPCDNPATVQAQRQAGKQPNVFYAYFTDAAQIIAKGQAADIQQYASTIPQLSSLIPSVKAVFQKDGTGDLYGLPSTNYTLGLIINRTLFSKAGLDPNKPPATWADVVADAKKIGALGNGTIGYAEYSAQNTGGWHFTAEMYSQGGDITSDGKTADFDNAKGLAVLQNLHQMRWVDNDMGSKQLLGYDDLNQMMASGKLGMMIGAPDAVQRDHDNFKADYSMLGMGPMPGGQGTLLGGDGYFFNPKDTPDQIKAGLLWLEYEKLTPGKGQFDYARASANKQAVGLPEPAIFQGALATEDAADKAKYATIPSENFAAYITATPSLKGNVEPPNAQAIYADLDKVMSDVLTNKNANLQGDLDSHAKAVSKLLTAAPATK